MVGVSLQLPHIFEETPVNQFYAQPVDQLWLDLNSYGNWDPTSWSTGSTKQLIWSKPTILRASKLIEFFASIIALLTKRNISILAHKLSPTSI